MKSPFAIFRKHQKVMTVILTGLAMFAFIVFGTISETMAQGISDPAKIFLAVIVGAGVAWVLGLKAKKSQEYAIMGAFVTGLAAVAMVIMNSPAPAVQTTFGSLTRDEMRELITQRQIANQFLMLAGSKTGLNQFQYRQFGFETGNMEQDVTLGYLFRHEADQIGIEVTDETVNNYINDYTQDKMTQSDFKEIRKQMQQISETRLYDILKEEIKAELALRFLSPNAGFSPEQCWDTYRKVNESQQLEIASLPVEDFASEIPDPKEEELVTFFNTYKAEFSRGPQFPGFREPPKVQLSYLEIDYVKTEEEVPEITEEEIKAFYEENKERYRNIVVPDEPANTPATSTVPPTGPELPGTKKPAEDQPISPEVKEEKKPADQPEKKSEPTEKPAPEKAEKPKNTEEKPAVDAPKPEAKEEAPKEEKTSSIGTDVIEPVFATQKDSLLALVQDDKGEEPKKEEPAKKEAPAKKEPAPEKKPEAEKKPAPEKKAEAEKPAEEPVKAEKKAAPKKEAPKEDKPAKEEKTEKKAPPAPVKEPTPEFKPLDNDLRTQIRDELLRQKTTELLNKKSEMALNKMRTQQEKIFDAQEKIAEEKAEEPEVQEEQSEISEFEREQKEQLELYEKLAPVVEEINKELKEYAQETGMVYVVTEPLAATELMDEEKNPFGQATDYNPNPSIQSRPVSLLQNISSTRFMVPFAGEIPSNNNRIVYWKLKDIPSRVPTFDEEGMKEKVLKAYKEFKAMDLVKERADELQKVVTESKKPLLEALGDQTVLGKEDSPKLTLTESQSFTWISFSSVPNLNQFMNPPQPSINRISGIENTDNEVMNTVFNQLKPGEVGVLKDPMGEYYYVVQPKNRKPSTEGELAGIRSNFMNSNMFTFFSPYRRLLLDENRNDGYNLALSLSRKYNVQPSLYSNQ